MLGVLARAVEIPPPDELDSELRSCEGKCKCCFCCDCFCCEEDEEDDDWGVRVSITRPFCFRLLSSSSLLAVLVVLRFWEDRRPLCGMITLVLIVCVTSDGLCRGISFSSNEPSESRRSCTFTLQPSVDALDALDVLRWRFLCDLWWLWPYP